MFPGTMRFSFFNKGFTIPESYRDPGILFVLRGSAQVKVGNEKADLGVSDYYTINSYEHFSVETGEDSLVGGVVGGNYFAEHQSIGAEGVVVNLESLLGTDGLVEIIVLVDGRTASHIIKCFEGGVK